MATRVLSSLFALLIGALPLLAADRAAEAKRYAADLKSKDAKTRVTALIELGKLGQVQRRLTAPYLSEIADALTDKDPKVRAEAAKTLGLIDPQDKKELIIKIADLLKEEKSEVARQGQETGLGELGATAEDTAVKKMAREALLAARKKTQSKPEQRTIQAALLMISGPKKKN